MKQAIILFFAILIIASCQKQAFEPLQEKPISPLIQSLKIPEATKKDTNVVADDFLNGRYNLRKRTKAEFDAIASKGRPDPKPPKGNNGNGKPPKGDTTSPPPPPPPPPPPTGAAVIYLNFNGKYLPVGSIWATNGLYVGVSGLTQWEKDSLFNQVRNDYAPFFIHVTTDSAVYAQAPIGWRAEVVITEDYQNITTPTVGGLAYTGSMFWTTQTEGLVAFVFSSLLHYNLKYIWVAITHEAAHTAGLRHQVDGYVDAAGIWNVTNPYSTGGSSDHAPYTGVAYYKPPSWWYGTNVFGIVINECQYFTGKFGPGSVPCVVRSTPGWSPSNPGPVRWQNTR
jgi:hypothetical protein